MHDIYIETDVFYCEKGHNTYVYEDDSYDGDVYLACRDCCECNDCRVGHFPTNSRAMDCCYARKTHKIIGKTVKQFEYEEGHGITLGIKLYESDLIDILKIDGVTIIGESDPKGEI